MKKYRKKIFAKTTAIFFCKNLQKDLCKKIVQKLLKKICAKIIAKKYVQKEPLRASKKTCFESLKASENTWWSWRLCVYYVLLLVATIVSEEVVYVVLTTYATLSYVPLFSTCQEEEGKKY